MKIEKLKVKKLVAGRAYPSIEFEIQELQESVNEIIAFINKIKE